MTCQSGKPPKVCFRFDADFKKLCRTIQLGELYRNSIVSKFMRKNEIYSFTFTRL